MLPTALLCLAIAFAPVTVVLGSAEGDPDVRPFLFVADIPLALAMLAVLDRVVRRRLRLPLPLLPLAVVAAWSTLAVIVEPSGRGVLVVLRLAAATTSAAWIAANPRARSAAGWTLAGAVCAQAAVAVLQLFAGGGIGLDAFGEASHPLWPFGPAEAPQGTMGHPYVLAGWAAVAAASAPHLVVVGLAAGAVGLTFSRAGALAVVVAAVLLLLGRKGRAVTAAVVLVTGFGAVAALRLEGWQQRVDQTTSARSEADLTTDRGELAGQAVDLIEARPVFGVGPGRYSTAVAADRPELPFVKPVHSVPLLAAAESGVVAGFGIVALLVTLGSTALRSGARRRALYFAWLPFVLLDHFPYDFQQGLLLTGVWAGLVAHDDRDPEQVDDRAGLTGRPH